MIDRVIIESIFDILYGLILYVYAVSMYCVMIILYSDTNVNNYPLIFYPLRFFPLLALRGNLNFDAN